MRFLSAAEHAEVERCSREVARRLNGGGDDADIERLAKLSTLQYEQERKEAAEKLGMRDAERRACR